MKELTLQELKDIEFDILKVFDKFCKENNIRYYFAYGTLLGAIRYKKFIPWDDDVDLLIPREDYDRMISLFKDTVGYQFCVEQILRFLDISNACFPKEVNEVNLLDANITKTIVFRSIPKDSLHTTTMFQGVPCNIGIHIFVSVLLQDDRDNTGKLLCFCLVIFLSWLEVTSRIGIHDVGISALDAGP